MSQQTSLRALPETNWSGVTRAAEWRGRDGQEALGALLRRYLPALRAHLVRKKGLSYEEAEDILQGFVADKVLHQGLLEQADRRKGRFRTFILTALDRYLVDAQRRAATKRRRPRGRRLTAVPEQCEQMAHGPDRFDVAWARQVVKEAVERMRADCRAREREDLWGLFRDRILLPTLEEDPATPYQELVSRYGLTSYAEATKVVSAAKRLFQAHLRAVVAEYAPTLAEVEEEVAELHAILAAARRS